MSCAEHHHPVYGGRSLPCFPGGTVAFLAQVLPPVFPRVYKHRTLFFIIIEERWGVLALEPIQVDLTACCVIYRNTVLLLGVAQGRGRVGGDNIRDRGTASQSHSPSSSSSFARPPVPVK